MSLSRLMAGQKARYERDQAQKTRKALDEAWLRTVPREFRMKDADGRVCHFVQHSHGTIYTVLVRYQDGTEQWRRLHEDVEWFPACWVDPKIEEPIDWREGVRG